MSVLPVSCRRFILVLHQSFYANYRNVFLKYNNAEYNKSVYNHNIPGTENALCVPATSKVGLILRTCSYTTKGVCWNCNHNLDKATIFCDSCSCLQPVNKNADLFEIIGIKCSFKIKTQELKTNYRNLQSVLHPDKFSSKVKKEQEISEEFSSFVNKAYTTLLDPLKRGFYLLKLQGVIVEENTTEVDKLFLMEIMELNEELENLRDQQKLSEFNKSNREQIESLIRQVEEAFDSNDLLVAKELLTKMKYYYTIENKVKDIKQKLNIPD